MHIRVGGEEGWECVLEGSDIHTDTREYPYFGMFMTIHWFYHAFAENTWEYHLKSSQSFRKTPSINSEELFFL